MLLLRRLFVSAIVGGGALQRQQPSFAAPVTGVRFQADDHSFEFELPQRWVGVTSPDQERKSAHLISVFAQDLDGLASVQALVDGGYRGREYGSSLSDLGTIEGIAGRLVQEELLNDDNAKLAAVVSSERVRGLGGTSYCLVRYQIGGKPAIAKLAVVQQRLYCLKVRAAKPGPAAFFEMSSALLVRSDMEALAESYRVSAVVPACLRASNSGTARSDGVCRRS
mmetsp:Transcript_33207/g.87293  ORF Transcript_33207/g.87293 Transcript_33207/m.87293 type:complete len:224 (-) Transcript_33207:231-902(-)